MKLNPYDIVWHIHIFPPGHVFGLGEDNEDGRHDVCRTHQGKYYVYSVETNDFTLCSSRRQAKKLAHRLCRKFANDQKTSS